MKKRIDLLVPTRSRPHRLIEFLDSIRATSFDLSRIYVYFYVDEDDDKTIEAIGSLRSTYEDINLIFNVEPRTVLSKAWNRLWEISNSEIIMHCADDIRFESDDWDRLVSAEFEKSKDQIIYVFGNDGITPKNHYGEGFATHGFVSRKSTQVLGYFVPPYFPCNFNDTWLNTLYGRQGWGPSYRQDGPERGINRKIELFDTVVTKHYHCSKYPEYMDSTETDMRVQLRESEKLYFSEKMIFQRLDDISKLQAYLYDNSQMKEKRERGEKIGWLVNDTLTCIPDTKTFWHDLLEWIPSLEDKTGTPFPNLAQTTENMITNFGAPDYIIRNATFFQRLNTDVKTISYLQDRYLDERFWHQLEVCNNSVVTIFNSSFVHDAYISKLDCEVDIIPIGTDFEHFRAEDTSDLDMLPDSILYVGSTNITTKGFDIVLDLIKNTNYNFCLVMKDDYTIEHPRVKVFNKIDHDMLKQVYNQSAVLLCPSHMETLHLAGIEAGACGTPIVANQVGVYDDLKDDERWGLLVKNGDFESGIKTVLKDRDGYDPRAAFLEAGLDKKTCRAKWLSLIEEVTK